MNPQGWDGLRKDVVWIKVWVVAVVAVAGPPARVNCELGQVGKPMSDQGGVNSGGSAAHQGAKRIEICRSRSLGHQVRIEELMVSDLIIRVIVNVLVHVFIQDPEGIVVSGIASSTRNFRVLDAAELVVLDPKVGLE